MKKIIILFSIFVLVIGTKNIFGQTKEEKKIAQKLCDCTQKVFKEYPPIFTQMMLDYAEFGEEKAQEKLMTKLMAMSPEEQQNFSKVVEEKPIEGIMEKYCAEAKSFIQKSKMDGSGEKGLEKIMAIMKKNKNCKAGYAMMLVGSKSKK